jgi:hypothetical protein
VILLDKQKILEIFEEVLKNWKDAESYVIQDTISADDNYDHEDLEKDVEEFRKKFLEALNS